jgi:HEAT repeat protein
MNDFLAELNSSNPDNVIFSLYTLLHEKNKVQYLEKLTELSNSSNDKIRMAVMMVLVKIKNNKLIPILEKALQDKIYKIRIIAAISLANYQNEIAIPILESAIKNDIKDHSLHKRTIEALGKYKKEVFISIFEQTIFHRRILSRIKSIDALMKIGTPEAKEILIKAEKIEDKEEIKMQIRNAIRIIEKPPLRINFIDNAK